MSDTAREPLAVLLRREFSERQTAAQAAWRDEVAVEVRCFASRLGVPEGGAVVDDDLSVSIDGIRFRPLVEEAHRVVRGPGPRVVGLSLETGRSWVRTAHPRICDRAGLLRALDDVAGRSAHWRSGWNGAGFLAFMCAVIAVAIAVGLTAMGLAPLAAVAVSVCVGVVAGMLQLGMLW